ncbi:hypothetical protein [Mesorhizobium sp. WSM4904]|uniref:hypothetical protein n=1 Tax=Mesorhizobium sp. WSM4904 TaxID=3038545 RepID=UPI0024185D13|nr:hypothetical protein [Mesorhizobium sp. WSM4904]WFP62089.1 hypothetical protein QAZ47_27070 [Mesorhizobium sp. WSM4904]
MPDLQLLGRFAEEATLFAEGVIALHLLNAVLRRSIPEKSRTAGEGIFASRKSCLFDDAKQAQRWTARTPSG